MRIDDEAADADLTPLILTSIDVDIDGLDAFRSLVLRELESNLRPGVEGILGDHCLGVHFGARNAGPLVQTARQRYWETLVRSTNNLAAYVLVAEAIIAALQRVAGEYRDADLRSAGMSTAVSTELANAIGTARQAAAQTRQHAFDQETHRELNRMLDMPAAVAGGTQ